MTEHSIKATLNGLTGTLSVDGHDLTNGIKGFTLTAGYGDLPHLEVEPMIFVGEVVGGPVRLILDLPDEARDALIAAGWEPPPDDEETA